MEKMSSTCFCGGGVLKAQSNVKQIQFLLSKGKKEWAYMQSVPCQRNFFCHFWSIVAAAVLQNNYSSAQYISVALAYIEIVVLRLQKQFGCLLDPNFLLNTICKKWVVFRTVITSRLSCHYYARQLLKMSALPLNKVLESEGENWYKLEWFYNAHKGNASSHFTILWSTFYWL